ncbi:hypothetical protein K3M68_01635 [Streptococcus dysgalactiae subsp. dysgalactiae]|uniref:hypothetical protein n=1 Tax=Streptococcus dysgalactiae TaxID=1334 RepID=UPI001CF58CBC|nr:hypothetical protein [Streptococcus dysgalactiae]MCB2832764.1 hypothetical protein [Streptococcus dysgalactiae subsp. dysgalactiae]
MTKAERIRRFYYENENPKLAEAYQVLKDYDISESHIKVTLSRDRKNGICTTDYDYTQYFETTKAKEELSSWKCDVRKDLVEQLLQANNHETDSNQIRLNAKTINQLLSEI